MISSCGRKFYYSNDLPNKELFFVINKDTEIFARKIYIQKNKFDGREIQKYDNDTLSDLGLLIEVQYIMINKNDILYVSTTPSRYIYDKTDNYLIESKSGKNSFPNSFYFNSFFKGFYEIENEKFVFKNEKNEQNWNIKISKNEIKLISIDNFNINNKKTQIKNYKSTEIAEFSFSNEIKFEKMKYFRYLSFKIPNDKNDYQKNILKNNNIDELKRAENFYVQYTNATKNKIKYIFLPFNKELIPGFSTLKYRSNRIRYY